MSESSVQERRQLLKCLKEASLLIPDVSTFFNHSLFVQAGDAKCKQKQKGTGPCSFSKRQGGQESEACVSVKDDPPSAANNTNEDTYDDDFDDDIVHVGSPLKVPHTKKNGSSQSHTMCHGQGTKKPERHTSTNSVYFTYMKQKARRQEMGTASSNTSLNEMTMSPETKGSLLFDNSISQGDSGIMRNDCTAHLRFEDIPFEKAKRNVYDRIGLHSWFLESQFASRAHTGVSFAAHVLYANLARQSPGVVEDALRHSVEDKMVAARRECNITRRTTNNDQNLLWSGALKDLLHCYKRLTRYNDPDERQRSALLKQINMVTKKEMDRQKREVDKKLALLCGSRQVLVPTTRLLEEVSHGLQCREARFAFRQCVLRPLSACAGAGLQPFGQNEGDSVAVCFEWLSGMRVEESFLRTTCGEMIASLCLPERLSVGRGGRFQDTHTRSSAMLAALLQKIKAVSNREQMDLLSQTEMYDKHVVFLKDLLEFNRVHTQGCDAKDVIQRIISQCHDREQLAEDRAFLCLQDTTVSTPGKKRRGISDDALMDTNESHTKRTRYAKAVSTTVDPALCYKLQEIAFLSSMSETLFDRHRGVKDTSSNKSRGSTKRHTDVHAEKRRVPCTPMRSLDVESRLRVDAVTGKIVYALRPPQKRDAEDTFLYANESNLLFDIAMVNTADEGSALFAHRT